MNQLSDRERLPCGCLIGIVDKALVITPCSSTCDHYAYLIEEMRKKQQPILMMDVRQRKLNFDPDCPHCGLRLNGFSSDDHRNTPQPGNLAVCAGCAGIGIFTEDAIRKPTPEEQSEIDADPDVQLMVQGVRALFK